MACSFITYPFVLHLQQHYDIVIIQRCKNFNQSAIDIPIIFIMCCNVYNVVLNVIGFQLYAYHGVHRIVAVTNISLHDVYTPALNTFWPFFVLKKVTLFQHEQNLYYPLPLAVVMLPRFSLISLMFFAFSVSHDSLTRIAKVSKEEPFFPPLSVGHQCTFLSCIFVQCCAFWALSVVHS